MGVVTYFREVLFYDITIIRKVTKSKIYIINVDIKNTGIARTIIKNIVVELA